MSADNHLFFINLVFSAVTMKLESRSLRMYSLLLCIWCFLHNGPFVRGDEQRVNLTKYPSDDVVESNTVQLICEGYGLQNGNVLEWSRTVMSNEVRIGRNGVSFNSTKYSVTLIQSQTPRSELFTIYKATGDDSGDYFCRIKHSDTDGAVILAVASYFVQVFYFPAAIYPICFPDGPFIVQDGTTQKMTCTTEEGNPTARVQIVSSGEILTWSTLTLNGVTTASTELTVDTTVNGIFFECKIDSHLFPGMNRSCTIGPMTVSTSSGTFTPKSPTETRVSQTTDDFVTETEAKSTSSPVGQSTLQSDAPSSTRLPTVPITMTDLRQSTNPQPTTATGIPIAIIAGAAGGGGGLLLLLIILFICLCGCKCCKQNDQKSSLQMSMPPELIHEISMEPNDFHPDTYLNSTGTFKNRQHEMKQINQDSMSGQQTAHSNSTNSVTTNLQNENAFPSVNETDRSERTSILNAPAFDTLDGHTTYLEDTTSEMSGKAMSKPVYAEVQKHRVSLGSKLKEQKKTVIDSSLLNSPNSGLPVYAEVQKNRASRNSKMNEQLTAKGESPLIVSPDYGQHVYAEVQADKPSQKDGKKELKMDASDVAQPIQPSNKITDHDYFELGFVPTEDKDTSAAPASSSNPASKPTAMIKPMIKGSAPSKVESETKKSKAPPPVVANKRNIKMFSSKSAQLRPAHYENVPKPISSNRISSTPPISQASASQTSPIDPTLPQQSPPQAKEQNSSMNKKPTAATTSSSEASVKSPCGDDKQTSITQAVVKDREEGNPGASANHLQDPDENPDTKDYDIMYAELDLEPDTSGKLPEHEVEPTMYASIMDITK